MDLVKILLEQHQLLRSEFESISALYRSPSGQVSQRLHDKMRETKHLVLAHMQLEDERFYPALPKSIESAVSVQADKARKDFRDLAGRYLEFIDRYGSLDSASQRVSFIQERMQVEEKEFYPLYKVPTG